MLSYCYASLRFSFSLSFLLCVIIITLGERCFFKNIKHLKILYKSAFQTINKNIFKIYVKKFVSLKIFYNFTAENETKNVNIMKATNLRQLSKDLRTYLISEFNFKDFSVKLESFNGISSMHIEIADNFKKRQVNDFIKNKDLKVTFENGKTKNIKYIFVLKK